MNYLLIGCYMAALAIYLVVRPAWRNVGPSLLDSFILGLSLFAAGSVAVWFEGLLDSESVMRIGIAAALSGTLGASFWSWIFKRRFAGFKFFEAAMRLRASNIDRFTITAGLAISSLVSLLFLVAVFSHEHVRSLLLGAVLGAAGNFNEARITVSSGAEGYFAPGYVKQFRDVLIPILCAAAVLCQGTYRNRALFYVALTVALASVFVSGQRLVVLQFVLCLGCVFLMDFFSSQRRRFVPMKIAVPMLVAMIALVGVMTEMLGRLDIALSPKVQAEQDKLALRGKELHDQLAANISRLKIEQDKLSALAPEEYEANQKVIQKSVQELKAERDVVERALSKLAEADQPGKEVSQTLASSGIPRPIAAAIALAHRAIIAVPRENATTYSVWASQSPANGVGWITDLSGLRPGTQRQLSNELSEATRGSPLGNSPLGLATDLYYNWGWPGLASFPLLGALLFLLIDIVAVGSNSPLLFAAKIFLFFSIPIIYSPFMFILYGGAVIIALTGYVWALKPMQSVD